MSVKSGGQLQRVVVVGGRRCVRVCVCGGGGHWGVGMGQGQDGSQGPGALDDWSLQVGGYVSSDAHTHTHTHTSGRASFF